MACLTHFESCFPENFIPTSPPGKNFGPASRPGDLVIENGYLDGEDVKDLPAKAFFISSLSVGGSYSWILAAKQRSMLRMVKLVVQISYDTAFVYADEAKTYITQRQDWETALFVENAWFNTSSNPKVVASCPTCPDYGVKDLSVSFVQDTTGSDQNSNGQVQQTGRLCLECVISQRDLTLIHYQFGTSLKCTLPYFVPSSNLGSGNSRSNP
jgi:hypothetical protein